MISVGKLMRLAILALVIPLAACTENKQAQEAATQGESAAPVNGEVMKVDKQAGMVTLKHGPIPHLGMSSMTMAFRVKEPAMLDQVKEGDKVDFMVDKSGIVTTFVPAK